MIWAIRGLRAFSYLWAGLVVLSVILGVVGFIVTAPTWADAWTKISTTFSPFNFWNTILVVLLLLPAYGASSLAARLAKRGIGRP